MKKKWILFGTVFISLFLFGTALQAYCQKVEVEQEFISDCTKAFDLVVEQRKQLANYAEKERLTEIERKAATATIAAMDSLMAVKDKTILSYENLVKTLQNAIEIQSRIITMLENRLLKPKSGFEKFLKALERVAVLAAGILIGKGL